HRTRQTRCHLDRVSSVPAVDPAPEPATATEIRKRQTVRADGRQADELREVRITPDWINTAEGSALVEFGNTRVLCAASLTEGVPRWLKGQGRGWVTAEYAMLPRATGAARTGPLPPRPPSTRPRVARDGAARPPPPAPPPPRRAPPPRRHRHGERQRDPPAPRLRSPPGRRRHHSHPPPSSFPPRF